MGKKFSGRRPENQPIFTRPDDLDFEKRRLFFAVEYSLAPPTKPTVIKVGRTATFTVAASDAPPNVRAHADYICDGTNDHVEIQAAIDALPATGGKIVLSQGTFYIESSLVLDSYQTLWGFGRSTVLPTITANMKFITATGGSGSEKVHIVISDLQVDGGASDLGDAGVYFEYTDYSIVRNVYARRHDAGAGSYRSGIYLINSDFNTIVDNVCPDNKFGIYLHTSSKYNIVRGNTCLDNGNEGIYLYDSADNNTVVGNVCEGNNYGIGVESLNNTVTGNICSGNTLHGIYLVESFNIIGGNICQGNGQCGIYCWANSNIIIGNHCTENSQTTDDTCDDIYIYNSDRNSVQGNTCRAGGEANKPRYGINVSNAACDGNIVINNDLYDDGFGTGVFNDSGTGTIYVEPGIDDIPVNGQLNQPISSNWAYDHASAAGGHSHMIWDAGVVSEELTYDARIAFDLGTSTQRY